MSRRFPFDAVIFDCDGVHDHVRRFFEFYRDAFTRLDAEAIAGHYAVPLNVRWHPRAARASLPSCR